jgi:hypothetical protein
MTENNAAQPGLTDDEIMRSAINASDSLNITRLHEMGAPSRTIMDDAGLLELGRAVESALLSKLRAEGVQAGDERFRSDVRELCAYAEGSMSVHIDTVHRVRAALASAPVAGEAIYQIKLPGDTESGWHDATDGAYWTATEKARRIVYAAPQASEAVRNAALEEAARVAESTAAGDSKPDSPYSVGTAKQAAARIRALKTQADKDGGDCAKGAAKRFRGLVEEAIIWLETGGGRADSLCSDLRKALAAQKQGDSDGDQ